MNVLPFEPKPQTRKTASGVVGVLAEAMGFRAPAERCRVRARSVVSEDEIAALVTLYAAVGSQVVRQAILDAMVAMTALS